MSPQKIQFPICHPRDIEQTALHLVATLLSRNCKDSFEDVITHIHTTAMTREEYTRSLALVVKMMIDNLLWRNSDMYVTLQDEIVDLAVATWIDYWNVRPQWIPPRLHFPECGDADFFLVYTDISWLRTRRRLRTINGDQLRGPFCYQRFHR
jgi:hypothetical protein